ncbi:MAG TPA: hypothetical protein V6D35_08330 [Candidatus Sericytochromatia bacterium]
MVNTGRYKVILYPSPSTCESVGLLVERGTTSTANLKEGLHRRNHLAAVNRVPRSH